MRDIRIIKGSAFRDLAASGSFDLPTEPLTNVSGTGYATALLACQGNNFKDYGDGNLSLAVEAGVGGWLAVGGVWVFSSLQLVLAQ